MYGFMRVIVLSTNKNRQCFGKKGCSACAFWANLCSEALKVCTEMPFLCCEVPFVVGESPILWGKVLGFSYNTASHRCKGLF